MLHAVVIRSCRESLGERIRRQKPVAEARIAVCSAGVSICAEAFVGQISLGPPYQFVGFAMVPEPV